MSGPLLAAVGGEGADPIRLSGNEVVGNPLVFPRDLEERAGPETSADDEAADSVGDVNKPINNFDCWRFFHEDRRVQLPTSFKHLSDPSLSTTEQRGLEPDIINQFNPLTFVGKRFLRTVAVARQTAVSVAAEVSNPTQESGAGFTPVTSLRAGCPPISDRPTPIIALAFREHDSERVSGTIGVRCRALEAA